MRSATTRRPHLRVASTPAAEIFLWSRLLVWGAAALALAWFPAHHGLSFGPGLWVRWDSGWFLRIAQHGYASDPPNTVAFFPLYPGLTAVLGRVLGDHYALAGLLIALAACLAAFELLWQRGLRQLGQPGALRAVLYLAVFPTAIFLQAVYSESLGPWHSPSPPSPWPRRDGGPWRASRPGWPSSTRPPAWRW